MTIDIVNAELSSSEEQNVTESAKTYKVNCDKRNITEMHDIAVQVLNSSQVILYTPHTNYRMFTSKTHQNFNFSRCLFLRHPTCELFSFKSSKRILKFIFLFIFSFRTWWSFWMPTAQSVLSCCFSPPGVSFQPDWLHTLMPCLAPFPACTSWL